MGSLSDVDSIEPEMTAQITTTKYGRLDCHVDVSPEGVYVATVLGHYDVPVRQVPSDDLGARSVQAALDELRRFLERN
jgi:hypothetical protein